MRGLLPPVRACVCLRDRIVWSYLKVMNVADIDCVSALALCHEPVCVCVLSRAVNVSFAFIFRGKDCNHHFDGSFVVDPWSEQLMTFILKGLWPESKQCSSAMRNKKRLVAFHCERSFWCCLGNHIWSGL